MQSGFFTINDNANIIVQEFDLKLQPQYVHNKIKYRINCISQQQSFLIKLQDYTADTKQQHNLLQCSFTTNLE